MTWGHLKDILHAAFRVSLEKNCKKALLYIEMFLMRLWGIYRVFQKVVKCIQVWDTLYYGCWSVEYHFSSLKRIFCVRRMISLSKKGGRYIGEPMWCIIMLFLHRIDVLWNEQASRKKMSISVPHYRDWFPTFTLRCCIMCCTMSHTYMDAI